MTIYNTNDRSFQNLMCKEGNSLRFLSFLLLVSMCLFVPMTDHPWPECSLKLFFEESLLGSFVETIGIITSEESRQFFIL